MQFSIQTFSISVTSPYNTFYETLSIPHLTIENKKFVNLVLWLFNLIKKKFFQFYSGQLNRYVYTVCSCIYFGMLFRGSINFKGNCVHAFRQALWKPFNQLKQRFVGGSKVHSLLHCRLLLQQAYIYIYAQHYYTIDYSQKWPFDGKIYRKGLFSS